MKLCNIGRSYIHVSSFIFFIVIILYFILPALPDSKVTKVHWKCVTAQNAAVSSLELRERLAVSHPGGLDSASESRIRPREALDHCGAVRWLSLHRGKIEDGKQKVRAGEKRAAGGSTQG